MTANYSIKFQAGQVNRSSEIGHKFPSKIKLGESSRRPMASGDPESYKAGKTSVAALGVHKPEMTQIFKKFWSLLFLQLNILTT